jgi:holliday junction DNA helicase RuvA
MIGQLTGTVEYCLTNPIIIGVGGVGYEVFVTPKMLIGLSTGDIITAYTHTHVRDDALELFGFPTRQDLDLFHQLITVPGVGPKTALLVIDKGALNVTGAISRSDVDFFMTVPRLGKKNAQKIIIELKNKLDSIADLDLTGNDGETAQLSEALMAMGFAKLEIANMYKTLQFHPGMKLEDKIRMSLKTLSKFKL